MPKKPPIPSKKNLRHASWISSSQPMAIMPLSRTQKLLFRRLPHRSIQDMELRTVFTVQMPTEERSFRIMPSIVLK
ncbi:hypothetical protein TNCV_1847051 [Trichonephila clavipes]|nr:hypothetical protein TNCV_1847051 [Trichonephila clavipes]